MHWLCCISECPAHLLLDSSLSTRLSIATPHSLRFLLSLSHTPLTPPSVFSTPSAQQAWETSHPVDSLQELLAPILADNYATFTSKRFTILLDDANAASTLKNATCANLTKVWTWWFPAPDDSQPQPSTIKDEEKQKVASSFAAFVSANNIDPSGIHSIVGGWRAEPDVIRGRAARSFTGFVGQRSSEEGVFRMAPPFEGNIQGRIGMGMRTFGFAGHGLA